MWSNVMEKLGFHLTNLPTLILRKFHYQGKIANEGCKDEKNTVILYSHASNPVNIRVARHYKVSQT
jgi:hypothetical protein